MVKIEKVKFRKILNSAGKISLEVEITDCDGIKAFASTPSAIQPGKREVTSIPSFYHNYINDLIEEICNIDIGSQKILDTILNKYMKKIGADICLSLSLAFARIMAQKEQISLVEYIAKIANYKTRYISPKPLVTIFSGGVHNTKSKGTLQNIMLSVNIQPFSKAITPILEIYTDIEKQLKQMNLLKGYGSSSGMLVDSITTEEKFKMVFDSIKKLGYEKHVTIAIDVAAEHLFENDTYTYQGEKITSEQFSKILAKYKKNYPLTFIEDPFAPDDEKQWKKFKEENSDIAIVGDDIFATQKKYINPILANGTLIKMNQVGTLTGTLDTFMKAKEEKMITCVSHRSIETEDTFMCDLAFALDSDYIKIGGPRRGDRIMKYNRLLKLEEENM